MAVADAPISFAGATAASKVATGDGIDDVVVGVREAASSAVRLQPGNPTATPRGTGLTSAPGLFTLPGGPIGDMATGCKAPKKIAGKRVRITCTQAGARAAVRLRRGSKVVARTRASASGTVRIDRRLKRGRYVLVVGTARVTIMV